MDRVVDRGQGPARPGRGVTGQGEADAQRQRPCRDRQAREAPQPQRRKQDRDENQTCDRGVTVRRREHLAQQASLSDAAQPKRGVVRALQEHVGRGAGEQQPGAQGSETPYPPV